MRTHLRLDIARKMEEMLSNIEAMSIHGVASITLSPARHFPASSENGYTSPEFHVSDLVITDEAGKKFTLTLFHRYGSEPATVTVPAQEAEQKPVEVACG